nr:hypothetical protein [Tanacetum cinerariifolium]
NNLFQGGVAVSGYCLETDDTENPNMRSDCTTIRGATVSVDTLAQTCSAWKTFDTRDAPSSYSKQKYTSISEQPIQDIPIPDDVHVSNTEDTNATHLINIKPRQDWLKPIPEEERQ